MKIVIGQKYNLLGEDVIVTSVKKEKNWFGKQIEVVYFVNKASNLTFNASNGSGASVETFKPVKLNLSVFLTLISSI
jgi:hypothetical protein